MATRYPAEFRQRAVELARQREKPIKQLATDLGRVRAGPRRPGLLAVARCVPKANPCNP